MLLLLKQPPSVKQKFCCFCRALEFFCAFTALLVSEYRNGSLDDSLLTAVYLAYDQSLKRHHNWFMRGTFYVRSHVLASCPLNPEWYNCLAQRFYRSFW